MAKDTNGIANVKDITEAFGVTLSTKPTLCPKYSVIIANSYLGVSGYTYTDKQLVRFQHIYKKEKQDLDYIIVNQKLEKAMKHPKLQAIHDKMVSDVSDHYPIILKFDL